jgi:hypothetical protein
MAQLNRLLKSFNQQVREIQPEGYILQGSVVRRDLKRRAGGALKTYGPYYLWTRKINKKTVTQALTSEQAQIIQEAIDRNRELEQRLTHLRLLSEHIIQSVSPCVIKRSRSKQKT